MCTGALGFRCNRVCMNREGVSWPGGSLRCTGLTIAKEGCTVHRCTVHRCTVHRCTEGGEHTDQSKK